MLTQLNGEQGKPNTKEMNLSSEVLEDFLVILIILLIFVMMSARIIFGDFGLRELLCRELHFLEFLVSFLDLVYVNI